MPLRLLAGQVGPPDIDPFLRAIRDRVSLWIAADPMRMRCPQCGADLGPPDDGDPAVFLAGLMAGMEIALAIAAPHPDVVARMLARLERLGPPDVDPAARHAHNHAEGQNLLMAFEQAEARDRSVPGGEGTVN